MKEYEPITMVSSAGRSTTQDSAPHRTLDRQDGDAEEVEGADVDVVVGADLADDQRPQIGQD